MKIQDQRQNDEDHPTADRHRGPQGEARKRPHNRDRDDNREHWRGKQRRR